MAKTELKMLGINKIEPNPFQPRETFEHEALKELSNSIGEMGVLQPILVRPKGKKFQIIAGERRWRACLNAKEKEIPALIRDMSDSELQIASLIENVHREDLKPTEQAKALLELGKAMELISKTDEPKVKKVELFQKLSNKTKISTKSIERRLQLLDLPEYIQKEVGHGGHHGETGIKITEDKALHLAKIEDKKEQKKVFDKIKKEDLSTGDTRRLVKIVEKAPAPIKKEVLKSKPKVSPKVAEKILELKDEETEKIVFEEAKKYDYSEREVEARVEDIKFSREKGIDKPAIEPPLKVYDSNKEFLESFQKNAEKILLINPKRLAELTKIQKRQMLRMIDSIEEKCNKFREILT